MIPKKLFITLGILLMLGCVFEDARASSNNLFLEYYPRQGTHMPKESSSFYFLDGKKLVKKSINDDSLHKTVIVFFGDWCPHCDSFLKGFANDVDILKSSGITVVFVAVPSIEKLKNWQEPSVEDFKVARDKISAHGIKLDKERVFVIMIGDKSVLPSCGVEGLPVLVAVKNGKEAFRTVGEKATSVMDLSDQTIARQFLEIWEIHEAEKHGAEEHEEKKKEFSTDKKSASKSAAVDKDAPSKKPLKKSKTKSKRIHEHKKKRARVYKKTVRKVDRAMARNFTERLNDYDYSTFRVPGLIFH